MKKTLKIGFVLDDNLDKVDGVQQYVLTLGAWLSRQGHDVHYLVGQTKRKDLKNLHSLSRTVGVCFNGNRMSMPLPASKNKIKQLLARQEFDVLHVQLPFSPWLAHRVIMAAPKSCAVVGTFHIVPKNEVVKLASKMLHVWTRKSWRRFDTVFAVSTVAKDFAKAVFGAEAKIIPNVVEVPRFANARAFPKYKDKITVLFLGRLVPRKGCMQLLKALNFMIKNEPNLPDFWVLICGKGPLLNELKTFVNNNHLKNIVEFTGFVSEEDKPRYCASADVSVFPSTGGESFGIVLVEAMASGNSIVLAGDNIGYRSVMSKYQETLFDPDDTIQLAEKIRFYISNEKLRKKIAGSQMKYAKTFDIDLVGQKVVSDYKLALHKRDKMR